MDSPFTVVHFPFPFSYSLSLIARSPNLWKIIIPFLFLPIIIIFPRIYEGIIGAAGFWAAVVVEVWLYLSVDVNAVLLSNLLVE